MKFATLFSGGELAGVGITAAGWRHAWGIEHDPAIAAVAERNGFGVTVADVLACDPHRFEPVDALHASPVCTRASNANHTAELNDEGTKEAPLDIAMGAKVAEFISVLAPRVVTIENVYTYRNFKAFKLICKALTAGGYFWNFDHLNAADFGVPQTRRRLILRAVKGALLPHLPAPVPWVGWYAAIEDLLDTLPPSEFAPWQLARLPEELSTALVAQGAFNGEVVTAGAVEPSFTVTANSNQGGVRAFLMAGSGNTNLTDAEPGAGVRYASAPAHTVGSDGGGRIPRAFLVSGQGNDNFTTVTVREQQQPSFTVVAATDKTTHRAWLSVGRVVAMTPRALARFQSVPDWYELPSDDNGLACKIIGNGCPPLMMQRVYEGLRP